jgi:hypothetical protein
MAVYEIFKWKQFAWAGQLRRRAGMQLSYRRSKILVAKNE